MNKNNNVAWDDLSYYDSKIKEYINEKVDNVSSKIPDSYDKSQVYTKEETEALIPTNYATKDDLENLVTVEYVTENYVTAEQVEETIAKEVTENTEIQQSIAQEVAKQIETIKYGTFGEEL